MASIIGAIASSHTPTIGFALDTGKQDDPAWAPIFEAYRPVQRWLAEKRSDVLRPRQRRCPLLPATRWTCIEPAPFFTTGLTP